MRPPRRIDAGGVVLHRWEAIWAAELAEAVQASLPELQLFAAWAHHDYDIESARAFLDQCAADWRSGVAFTYALRTTAAELVGSAGLMTRLGPPVLEIGYWTHTARTGRGIATAAAFALAETALAMPGIDRVVIRHDAANVASAAVARKAGFTQVAQRPSTLDKTPGMVGTEVIWERRARRESR